MSSFADYLDQVEVARIEHPEWRIGQTAFNILARIKPGLAEEVRGTSLDPFHASIRVEEFYTYIADRWNRP